MTVQSKLATTLCTCKDFQHPWTDSCVNATAGLLLSATPYCLRVYSMVYVLSLVMRHKIPTLDDLRKTVQGILQSTAFLVTNSYGFIMFNCLLRYLMGHYTVYTAAFLPTFLASLMAIVVERPQRRPLLALYVANVATESLWNMAVARGWAKSIPNGQVLIFGASISTLLYLYRLGLHKTTCKDSLFGILRIFVGKTEEGDAKGKEVKFDDSVPATSTAQRTSRPPVSLSTINGWVQLYSRFIGTLKGKHESCTHKCGCLSYAVMGGLKPLLGGIGIQVALKLVMNFKKVIQNKLDWKQTILNKKTLNLGLFLGSFSFLYKSVSCGLRHSFNRDDPRFAIPAGLIGSLSFFYYPDTTVALYVMWKTLQIVYNLGIKEKKVPEVPGFTILLYAFCTAVLFHSGIMEAKTLRPSYYRFLQAISGQRLNKFNLVPMDAFGLNTFAQTEEVLKAYKLTDRTSLPQCSLASW
ncbi:transmembrane protein 135 [Stomoxys calcitrans]|uniref:transmembrane protein 135 n=1 Tax=Stomoxys calcitrans TaxID=35570 RepID=UPI0027E23C71|nr:transmembrane protein 135 [Stomoxys calcitrans]XP_059219376.1 transmembrane protein 135 [Stomoxys calcitrans]